MLSSLLSFVPQSLQTRRVLPAPGHVIIEANLRRVAPICCPACGFASDRVHSGYKRVLRDLPWQGRPVIVEVAARRMRCLNIACRRRTFVEPLGGVAMAFARRTSRLGDLQRHLALALGGEAGARLAQRLAMPSSADTLLRMAASPLRRELPPTPRVLGVDDWAWRRGRRYGTILVDLERNQVVDLLPDRQAETLATWLRRHPGIEVVARDRAGAYAEGVRQGAPGAVQVADRWHILRSLGDAVRAVVDRQHIEIRRVVRQWGEPVMTTASLAAAATVPPSVVATRAERRRQDAYARRQARYEEAARLRTAGVSIKRIAALLGVERKTVRVWLRAGGAPLWRKPPMTGMLGPYLDHLERRWIEGCRNAAQLWRELVAFGFAGRPGCVKQWAGRRRKGELAGTSNAAQVAPKRQPPSTRQLARMLMAEPGSLPEAAGMLVSRLLEHIPGLADGIAVAKRLNMLLRRESDERLSNLLADGARTVLKEFATSLQRDIAAVQAALDLPWTTSPVEGQVNRLKMLKRQMYGRANFGLLRARVLHTA